MRQFSLRLAAAVAIAVCGGSVSRAQAASEPALDLRGIQCEKRWTSLFAQHGGDIPRLRAEWTQAAADCQGTGVYELRLATVARLEWKFDEVIRILEPLQAQKALPAADERLIVLEGTRFDQAWLSHPADTAAMKASNAKLEALLERRPDLMNALITVGTQRAQLKDYQGSAELARKVLQMEPQSWTGRRILVVAAAGLNQCAEARPHIRPAVEAKESLLGDTEFMLASAFCYLRTGDVLTAEQVLRALQSRVPEVKSDPGYRNMTAYVLEEKAKLPAKGNAPGDTRQ